MTAPDEMALEVGLGLRRALLKPLDEEADARSVIDFLEVAPENWMGIGGRRGKAFRRYTERYPLICHGLSLSLGGPDPLDEMFLERLRRFLDSHGALIYSEHLSYCTDDAHLYDLLPIPFTTAAVAHVAARIRRVQDLLGRRIAIENASYYTPLASEMSDLEFLLAVVQAADCDILLDVNNVYVNSTNHRYDPYAFIDAIPPARVRYLHIAGHYREAPDLIVDTHGAAVIDPVYDLLAHAYTRIGPRPTLLERDFNIPAWEELRGELNRIRAIQAAHRSALSLQRSASLPQLASG